MPYSYKYRLTSTVILIDRIYSADLEILSINSFTRLEIICVGGYFIVDYNPALTSLAGMEDVNISVSIGIGNCPTLTNISQLNSVTSLSANLNISFNDSITNLDGLQNLVFVGNDIQIAQNSQLNDFCALTNLYQNGTIPESVIIQDNAYNPSENQMEIGSCSN